VTKFPENPLTGAHDIHTYCLGHTNFVACVAFIGFQGLLISGGGDATVMSQYFVIMSQKRGVAWKGTVA
jgi:hypothetical protein